MNRAAALVAVVAYTAGVIGVVAVHESFFDERPTVEAGVARDDQNATSGDGDRRDDNGDDRDDDGDSRKNGRGASGGGVTVAVPDTTPVPPRPGTVAATPPTRAVCDRTVRTGESIQDAIDAAPNNGPYVLCLTGVWAGGGEPGDGSDRPGVGPYWGNIVIRGRADFTLRGVDGAVITGIPNDQQYPPEDAPPDQQHPNDKALLIKIQDSERVALEGLTIDGHVYPDLSAYPEGGEPVLNRLVWLQNTRDSTVRYNVIRNAGGECVRVKSNSTGNEITRNDISACGYWQFKVQPVERLRKNGEAVYIGTDPAQIATTQVNKQRYWGLDPDLVTDRSARNRVTFNNLAPGPPGADWGNECVDIKEDWEPGRSRPGDTRGDPGGNIVADNLCTGQFDPESGALNARGPGNIFEHNWVYGTVLGAAVRLGGGDPKNIAGRDVKWQATGNTLRANRLEAYGTGYAVKVFDGEPQAAGDGVCGNTDAAHTTGFGGRFSRQNLIENLDMCPDRAPPGPRGPVGAIHL